MSTETANTGTTALPLSPGDWALDPFHSSVGFVIRHLGISKVRGRFNDFTASLRVGETLADVEVTATVEIASIDTGNADRDAHVRREDMLDVARRPRMTFRSTEITGSGEDWTMAGDLTIGDVTRPITFAVEFDGVREFPGTGSRHAGFEATGELSRKEFGLGFGAGMLGDTVKIQLDMQFVEPSS
ncbi:YceI family protein [Actinomadura kijaniata]|uniref:YceI family protein n=1 Tax=Actinomadura kijaniata TaxID=46161 RepID=UPI003F1A95DC